ELLCRRFEDVSLERLRALGADLWWASPPCQPFTVRGLRRDLEDPRAATFRLLVERLSMLQPRWFALENVAGFEDSAAHRLLRDALDTAGYATPVERVLCPSALGWPNRRPRFYLVASREADGASEIERAEPAARVELRDLVDPAADRDPTLVLDETTRRRYHQALHLVDRRDDDAVSRCFTSAYGRSIVRSGSYLRRPDGKVRRFSPREIARLLGFPETFGWPDGLSVRRRSALLGRSLSLVAVRSVLAVIPGIDGPVCGLSPLERPAVSPVDLAS
ncbi:MAG: DNA cytosine methyltransferase, partial [Acidobacteriota bacterium]